MSTAIKFWEGKPTLNCDSTTPEMRDTAGSPAPLSLLLVKLSGGGVLAAALPPAASWQGALMFVTDATLDAIVGLGTIVAGTGANKVLVYSDGTNWLIL